MPGAIKLHWRDDLRTIERDLVEKDAFEKLMSERGISNDATLVLYGDKNNWFAAYAYWYLKIYGHKDVRVLDGGRQKWIDEGRELTADAPSVTAVNASARDRDETIRARRDAVLKSLGNDALVDVRRRRSTPATSLPRRATSRRGRSAAGTSRRPSRSHGRPPFATTGRSSRRTSCASCTPARA